MRIALLGQFGSGNTGNDGSLEAMVRFLRVALPDADLISICSGPATVAREYGIQATSISSATPTGGFPARLNVLLKGAPHRMANLIEAFRRTRGVDWVVVPGTGILDDYRDNPFGWPFVLLRWCLAARINGSQLAFVSIGAGPIRHPLSRRFLKWSARLARYRSYRDKVSRDFMGTIGFDVTGDPVVADIAFGLPLPLPDDAVPDRPLSVGVGAMSYRGWSKSDGRGEEIYQAYIGRLAQFVLRLVQDGRHVRLLTGDLDDWAAVTDLRTRLAELLPRDLQARIVAEEAGSLAELTRQMMDTDIVVTSRYHNVVCALKLGLPTISLSYADKNDALLSECGLGGFSQPIETFSVDVLAQQFDRLVAERAVRTAGIRRAVKNIAERLKRQEVQLSRALSDRAVPVPVHPTLESQPGLPGSDA